MSASKGHRCFFLQILSFLEITHYDPDMYKLAKVSLDIMGVMHALTLSSPVKVKWCPLSPVGCNSLFQDHLSWMVLLIRVLSKISRHHLKTPSHRKAIARELPLLREL